VATHTWTILALNALVGHESGVGIDMYCRLHTHPDCPPRLHAFFAGAPGRVTPQPVPNPPAPAAGSAAAAGPRYTLQELVARSRLRARPSQGAPRPYNRTDPGVQWASRIMNPGRAMFSAYQWSEIMEVMEGTGDWATQERWEILQQTIDLTLGEPFLCGFPQLTIEEGQELMRQEAALGRLPSAR
jgi:hypothetical protein